MLKLEQIEDILSKTDGVNYVGNEVFQLPNGSYTGPIGVAKHIQKLHYANMVSVMKSDLELLNNVK